MRCCSPMIATLALACAAVATQAQASSPWFVESTIGQVSGPAVTASDGRHHFGNGSAGTLTVGRHSLPWLALTVEGAVIDAREADLRVSIPEGRWTTDRGTHGSLTGGVRLEAPVRFGLAPSLQIGTGVGWLRWGDQHVTQWDGSMATVPGEHEALWAWSTAFNLRLATPQRWLSPEATAAVRAFDEGGQYIRMTTLGIGLRY